MEEASDIMIEAQNARNLWATAMWLAISDLAGEGFQCVSKMEKKRAQKSASAWFNSRERDKCAFEWCCDVLGLNPGMTRQRILSDPMSLIYPTKTIGNAIRRCRARILITQEELVRQLGARQAT